MGGKSTWFFTCLPLCQLKTLNSSQILVTMNLKKVAEYSKIEIIVLGDMPYLKTIDGAILGVGCGMVELGSIKVSHLYGWNSEAFICDNESNRVYSLMSNLLTKLPYIANYVYPIDINKQLVYGSINSNNTVRLYDSSERQWENESTGFVICFNNGFYVYKLDYNSNKIQVRNTADFALRFGYEYDSTFKVGRAGFISQNTLIVPFLRYTPKYEARIVALDLRTGNELWELEARTHEFTIDDNLKKLFALTESSSTNQTNLEIVDIIEGKIERSIISGSISRGMFPSNAIEKDGFLFYSDNIEGCKIGVIELNSKSLIGEIELGLEYGVKIYAPKVFNDRIFVLDTSNVCHEIKIDFNQEAT